MFLFALETNDSLGKKWPVVSNWVPTSSATPRILTLALLVILIGPVAQSQPPSDPPGEFSEAAVSEAADIDLELTDRIPTTDSSQKSIAPAELRPEELSPEEMEAQADRIIQKELENPNAVLEEFLKVAPEEIAEEGKKAKEEFERLRKELTDAVYEMRVIHTRYVNEEAKTDEDADRYYEQRDHVRNLMKETFTASLNVYRYMQDHLAAQYMLTTIQYREPRDVYDLETLEAATRLMDTGHRFAFVYIVAARSAICVGQFDLAERIYSRMDEETLEDTDKGLIAQMESLKLQWEAEQKLREREAEKDELPLVKLKTSRGEVLIELYIDQAPSTVSNFIQLVEDGFYDGLDFFQVIKRLLALTGDEMGDGSAIPEKFLVDEHDRDVVRSPLRGSLVMAKIPIADTGEFIPNSAGTQFAILMLPMPLVNTQQTIFGRVIEGMDVIGELRRVDALKKKEKNEISLPPDRIESAEVVRRPDELPEVIYVRQPGTRLPNPVVPEVKLPPLPSEVGSQ